MKRIGYVAWFDEPSGEGEIFDPLTKESLYVHWSAIKMCPSEIFAYKNLKKNQAVEFTVYENLYMKQIDSVWPLVFNYTVENEHKLQQLLNQLWEIADDRAFDITELYYNETLNNHIFMTTV